MLFGYAVSGDRTLTAFYQRLLPFAEPFMALFGRAKLPHPATLSRFLAALDQGCVEALRTLCARRSGGTTGVRLPTWWGVGPTGPPVDRGRCRWNTTGCQTTGASADRKPSRPSSPL